MREFKSIFGHEIHSYIKGILDSERTAKNQEAYLGRLDQYLCDIGLSEKMIDEGIAISWLKSMNAKPNSQSAILSYYRGFANYLAAYGYKAFIPDAPYAAHTYVPHIYSEDEINRIFFSCDTLSSRYKENRSPVMMSMLLRILYCTGMRLREALTLRVGQVDLDNACILLLKTKNKRERWVPVHPQLKSILKQYMAAMNLLSDPEAPLFHSSAGTFFTNAWAQYWFGIILSNAGLKRTACDAHERDLCMHCFRHGYTYLALKQSRQKGMSFDEAIPFISTYLGHKDISDTDYYMNFGYALFDEEQTAFSSYTSGMFPEVKNED